MGKPKKTLKRNLVEDMKNVLLKAKGNPLRDFGDGAFAGRNER